MRNKLTEAGFEVMAKTGKEHMVRVAKEVRDVPRHHREGRHQEAVVAT